MHTCEFTEFVGSQQEGDTFFGDMVVCNEPASKCVEVRLLDKDGWSDNWILRWFCDQHHAFYASMAEPHHSLKRFRF